MAVQGIGAVARLARSMITYRMSGLWLAVRTHLEGRNAVRFERERRITLLTVPLAVPPGTAIHDQRADGSMLRMHVPAIAPIDVILGGNIGPSIPQAAERAAHPLDHCTRRDIGTTQDTEC